MLRILQVIEGLYAGGMESMLMNYFRNFDRDKIVFDFLIYSPKAHFDDEVEKLGGKIYRITPRRQNPLKNYYELLRFFQTHKEYQIVQVHQGINYFAPQIVCKLEKVRHVISHTHGMNPQLVQKQGFLFKWLTQPLIKNLSTDYIACSDGAAHQIFHSSISEGGKYRLMKNAIDIDKFAYDPIIRTQKRKELGIENCHVIGHVGNFTYPKNHPFIIKIFSKIAAIDSNAILLLAGEGCDKQKIEKMVNDLNIEDRVKFLGNRSDVNELLQAFDIFFFPSHYEGLPVSLVEAQASGIRCIVSTTITREVEVTKNIKYLSLNDDEACWVDALMQFNYSREDTRKDILNAGFDIKHEAKQMTEYYYQLDSI